MTSEEVKNILRAADEAKAKRAADMPTEEDAMKAMQHAFTRLRDLGWAESIYSPKDGTVFEALEAGCTKPGRCHYMGEWPSGGWWIHSDNDLWPSRPILWRPLKEARK